MSNPAAEESINLTGLEDRSELHLPSPPRDEDGNVLRSDLGDDPDAGLRPPDPVRRGNNNWPATSSSSAAGVTAAAAGGGGGVNNNRLRLRLPSASSSAATAVGVHGAAALEEQDKSRLRLRLKIDPPTTTSHSTSTIGGGATAAGRDDDAPATTPSSRPPPAKAHNAEGPTAAAGARRHHNPHHDSSSMIALSESVGNRGSNIAETTPRAVDLVRGSSPSAHHHQQQQHQQQHQTASSGATYQQIPSPPSRFNRRHVPPSGAAVSHGIADPARTSAAATPPPPAHHVLVAHSFPGLMVGAAAAQQQQQQQQQRARFEFPPEPVVAATTSAAVPAQSVSAAATLRGGQDVTPPGSRRATAAITPGNELANALHNMPGMAASSSIAAVTAPSSVTPGGTTTAAAQLHTAGSLHAAPSLLPPATTTTANNTPGVAETATAEVPHHPQPPYAAAGMSSNPAASPPPPPAAPAAQPPSASAVPFVPLVPVQVPTIPDAMAKYAVKRKLGEGTYGEVFLATDRTSGEPVAVKKLKVLERMEGLPNTTLREITILRSLARVGNVSQFTRLREVAMSPSFDEMHLIFDFVEHSLYGLMVNRVKFTDSDIRCVFRQVMKGLATLHEANIVHRDIKPNNILVDANGCVKLCDFGLAFSTTGDRQRVTPRLVALAYRPPEMLLNAQRYSSAVDVWSVGCMMVQMYLGGAPPFMVSASEPASDEATQLALIAKAHKLTPAHVAIHLGLSPTAEDHPPPPPLLPGNNAAAARLTEKRIAQSEEQLSRNLAAHISSMAVALQRPPIPANVMQFICAAMRLQPERRPTARQLLSLPWFANAIDDVMERAALARRIHDVVGERYCHGARAT